MKLYIAPNTISIAVYIALEEAGLAYEAVPVDFANAAQNEPAYRAINPKGRVPTLEIDGTYFTETGALLEMIAAMAPEAGLVPTDPKDAARMREVMYYLASTMHVNHAHKGRAFRWADKEDSWADMAAKVPETMSASSHYIEAHGLRDPFVVGDNLSLADPYLFMVCSWLGGDGVDVSDYPRISAFMDRMGERASVQKARANGVLR